MFRVRRFLLLLFCLCFSLHAQENSSSPAYRVSQSPDFTLKASVYRVLVDVTVTDSHGNPVHGLTESDFAVKEDGKPQKVLYFHVYNFGKGMAYTPPKFPALPPNTFVNLPSSPERGPLYVLLYDLVNIPEKYQPVARAQLVKFIQEKPVGARMAIIVSSDGLHLVQGFTADKQKLLAAVNPKSSHPHVPMIFLMGVNFGQGDPVSAAGRLDEIAQYLAPMPGRKNLIWFSSKFPMWLFASLESTVQLQALAKKTLNLLADNRIAVYPVDATGLPAYESYASPANSHAASGASHGVSLLYRSYWRQNSIAKVTGGQAIYSRNRLAGALAEAVEDGGSYYTLAYSPSNKDFKGRLRHIEIAVKSGNYHLSYRRAYYGTRESVMGRPSDRGITSVMEHGAPEYHQLIFGVHIEKNPPRHGSQMYSVEYIVMVQQLRAGGDVDPGLEIAADVYDADGRLLNSAVNKAFPPSPSTKKQRAYRMEIKINVPRTAKFMRFGVRDLSTGRMGALEIPLPLHPW